jgi:hypothetical protein
MDSIIGRATKLGHDAGIAAASWVFDGNTSPDTYRRYAEGIAAGDPEILDSLREPNLSGEYADDYSERDLARDLGIEPYSDDSDAAATAWAEAASEAFWAEVERIARLHNPDEPVTRRRDGIAYLLADGDLRVPCSRYGRWTSDCAPVAWRVAYLVARESGEAITHERLDHAMGLVVNDHDDVAYIVREYGHGHYR